MTKLLSKKVFWYAFIAPFVIFFGLFFLTTFLLPINVFVKDNWSISLLVGQITIYVVFFTFVQLSFSSSEIPKDLIRKYIIHADFTSLYIGYNLSAILILVYNSICSFNTIGNNYTINGLLSLLVLFISVINSIKYIFWLTQKTTFYGIGEEIINNINLSELEKDEYLVGEKSYSFNSEAENLNIFPITKFILNTNTHRLNIFWISEDMTIESINLKSFRSACNKCEENVKIFINIEPNGIIKKGDIILTIVFKEEENKKKCSENINKITLEIINSIITNNNHEYKYVPIFDLITLLYYVSSEINNNDAKKLLNNLRNKIYSWLSQINSENNISKKINIKIIKYILSKMIYLINQNIKNRDITDHFIEVSYIVIYILRNISFECKLSEVTVEIVHLHIRLQQKILYKFPTHHNHLYSSVLRIKELMLSPILFNRNKIITQYQIDDLKYLFFNAIYISADLVLFIINNAHKINTYEKSMMLQLNIDYFITLLDLFQSIEDESFIKSLYEYSDTLSDFTIVLAIILTKKITNDKFDTLAFSALVVPMLEKCENISKNRHNNSFEVINKAIKDKEFINNIDQQFASELELNHITGSGFSEPDYYEYNIIWVFYLFYLRINKKNEKYNRMLSILKNADGRYYADLLTKYDDEFLSKLMQTTKYEISMTRREFYLILK